MKINLVSLGCDKNLVDAEYMLGLIAERGYSYTDVLEEADIAIVNTCCFIHDAKEESINAILELAELKADGKLKGLIVTGCLAQRYKEEITEEIPEVDALLGASSYDRVLEVIDGIVGGRAKNIFQDLDRLASIGSLPRVNATGGWYSYLKIAEGCNKNCTYCIIPSIRGHYRSYPIEDVLKQAEDIVKKGISELIVVAQETTIYGLDLYGYKALPELLKRLCAIEGLKWLRILYCYPEEIDDALIEVIATEEKICKYLDIPIQHASDRILRRMARRTAKKDIIEIVGKLRSRIPDIVLRTTLITGFPGEEEEDYEELKDFVEEMCFERLGVFTYSPEEDTVAAKFENQVDEEVKTERREEIMLIQQDISRNFLAGMIGKELDVMIEGKLADEDAYVARSYMDSPNIDGVVFVNSDLSHNTGDFVRVRIIDSSEYDLIGELV